MVTSCKARTGVRQVKCPGHKILGDMLRLVQVQGQHLRVSATLSVSSWVTLLSQTLASGTLSPIVVLETEGLEGL